MKKITDLTEEEIESHFEMSRRFRPSPTDEKPILTEKELEQLFSEMITRKQ